MFPDFFLVSFEFQACNMKQAESLKAYPCIGDKMLQSLTP